MSSFLQKTRATWLTARRAGLRRLLFRMRRRMQLRLLNPYLANYLYAANSSSTDIEQFQTNQEICSRLNYLAQLRQQGHLAAAWDSEKGSIVLLNQVSQPLQPPVNWSASPIADPLWAFQQHSWEWAWPRLGEPEARSLFLDLWSDWLDQVPCGRTLAWEPYPTSRRLVVWAAAAHLLSLGSGMETAITQHANYVRHHLERDLDNNHLIANAKGLAWAGLLMPHLSQAAKWRKTGLAWLWRSLQDQIRPDGGHIENSTGYHLAVWLDGLETLFLCQAVGQPVPPEVSSVLERMGDYALALIRPDGRLPLLNDCVQDEPIPLAAVLDLAAKVLNKPDWAKTEAVTKSRILPDSGQVILRPGQGKTYLLFDAGDIGPDHCPGHGHADTLSFELWYQETPLIVDPGTYQYPAGKWRDYFRSTAVHSTATVDKQNQTIFTGPFRVGDMAHGRLLSFDLTPGSLEAVGEHDGYKRLTDPVTHRRHIRALSAQKIIVTDMFTGKANHQIALHFHLVTRHVELLSAHRAIVHYPDCPDLLIHLDETTVGHFTKTKGWISRTWYQKEASTILTYQTDTLLPLTLTTTLEITGETDCRNLTSYS